MDNVVLTAEQLAHIVCLPRQQQLNLLKKVTEGKVLKWQPDIPGWVPVPKDKPKG